MGDKVYTVKSGDCLSNIVKREYGFQSQRDIMNAVNMIGKANNLKNVNLLSINQELKLPNLMALSDVTIFTPGNDTPEKLRSTSQNYYRAVDVFGDVGDAKRNQDPVQSTLNEKTKSTTNIIEDVFANVKGYFNNSLDRDARMADIFAKQVGKWQTDDGEVSGCFAFEKTDAYAFALSMNSDDYSVRESEYKGNTESHAYYNPTTSDGKIRLFSAEIIDGKEYMTMRDNDGNVHYFDKSDNLKEKQINQND